MTTLTAAQIDAGLLRRACRRLSGKAKCDVKVVALELHHRRERRGPRKPMPRRDAGACRAPRRARRTGGLRQGHGHAKPRTLANPQDNETFLLAAMYAAQGMPWSRPTTWALLSGYAYHPYLHADSGGPHRDRLRCAARAAAPGGRQPVGQGHVHGVLQGGHASMAPSGRPSGTMPPSSTSWRAPTWRALQPVGPLQLTDAIAGFQFLCPTWSRHGKRSMAMSIPM